MGTAKEAPSQVGHVDLSVRVMETVRNGRAGSESQVKPQVKVYLSDKSYDWIFYNIYIYIYISLASLA